MSSRERDVDATARDDQADSPPTAGRTRTMDRTRAADAVFEVDDDDELVDRDGDDQLPTELVPAIDPLLPPVPRTHDNGDGNGHVEVLDDVADGDIDDDEVATTEELKSDDAVVDDDATVATIGARVAEPSPVTRAAPSTPTPTPPAPPVTQPTPALTDTSNPIPIITRRATVVGAERHLVAPVHRAIGRRPRVRKVTRVVRHVDPWTVFKVAAVFSVVIYGVLLTSGVLLWNVAYTTGTVDNIERFFESFGWETFEFNGGQIYHAAWIAGLFGTVALTGFAVLGATLFNLITDIVGGVRFTVLEEEVVEKTASPMRRFTVRRTETDPTPSSGTVIDERVNT